jgi:hypothetical protein
MLVRWACLKTDVVESSGRSDKGMKVTKRGWRWSDAPW